MMLSLERCYVLNTKIYSMQYEYKVRTFPLWGSKPRTDSYLRFASNDSVLRDDKNNNAHVRLRRRKLLRESAITRS